MKRRRRLRPEEEALWSQIAARTEPIRKPAAAPSSAKPPPIPRVKPGAPQAQTRIGVFRLGEKARDTAPGHAIAPSIEAQVAAAPLNMDRKAFGRLKRGKLRPEGRIDLHGMTLDRAQPALTRFILSAQASGKRLVLVITGKGRKPDEGGPIPVRQGVLRHHVPNWLASPPLGQAVLQVTQAHLSHGGGGAYYVYLRKLR